MHISIRFVVVFLFYDNCNQFESSSISLDLAEFYLALEAGMERGNVRIYYLLLSYFARIPIKLIISDAAIITIDAVMVLVLVFVSFFTIYRCNIRYNNLWIHKDILSRSICIMAN
jgi:hypothetical protein